MTSASYTTGYNDAGVHTVTVTVSDGSLTDSQDVTITVNDNPIIVIPVTWVDTVGVTVNGNSITKNAPTGWGNGGAASLESFTGDGGVEFIATQNNIYDLCGLSSTNPDAHWKSIEYGISRRINSTLQVYEKGVFRGSFGSFQIGDKLSVERVGSTIVYKKNGVIFYTSLTPAGSVLLVDCAIYNNGGEISDVKLIDMTGIGGGPL
jgi:PKD repeat protein